MKKGKRQKTKEKIDKKEKNEERKYDFISK